MGASCSGGPLLRRAPLRVEDPRAETSGFKESTPVMISHNKGQCNERLAQAVWGSSDRQGGGLRERSAQRKEGALDQTKSRGGSSSTVAEAATKLRFFARRTTKPIETIGVCHLRTHLTYAHI